MYDCVYVRICRCACMQPFISVLLWKVTWFTIHRITSWCRKKISHSLLNQPHSQSIEICIELYLLLLPKVAEICFWLYFYLQWETCLHDIHMTYIRVRISWLGQGHLCSGATFVMQAAPEVECVWRGEGSACSWQWPAADFLWLCLMHLSCLLHCQISTTWLYRMFSPHWWK